MSAISSIGSNLLQKSILRLDDGASSRVGSLLTKAEKALASATKGSRGAGSTAEQPALRGISRAIAKLAKAITEMAKSLSSQPTPTTAQPSVGTSGVQQAPAPTTATTLPGPANSTTTVTDPAATTAPASDDVIGKIQQAITGLSEKLDAVMKQIEELFTKGAKDIQDSKDSGPFGMIGSVFNSVLGLGGGLVKSVFGGIFGK